jgi:uncharacterized damage-inducible protein DinB
MSELREHFARLIDHVEWADAKALESLRGAPHAPPKAFEVYSHILGSQHVWLSRINGRQPEYPVWPKITLDECTRLSAANIAEFRKLVSSLTTARLTTGITYRNSAGDEFTSTVEDILTHVTLHSAYHRGQVAALIRAAGATPSPTDYIAFVRGAPAATRQS